ncbi:MAG: gamma-glutamylcyclotransferase [Desulfobacterales bacterium]|jgi:gamma-glutamylcyclotransferase (GGCT)/AIG2-like uncharacterized protein YtfP
MNLFAYGTLMDPEIMHRVSGFQRRSSRAVLFGYVRKALRGEVYPAIAPRKGASVEGILYFELPPEAVARIDRFEGSLYNRTEVVAVIDGSKREAVAALAYVIAGEHLDRLSDRDWSFKRFLETGKGRFQSSYEGYGKLE